VTESKCNHEVSIWSMADLRLVNRPRNGRAEGYQRPDMHLQKPSFSLGRVGGVPFHRLHRTMHDVKRCGCGGGSVRSWRACSRSRLTRFRRLFRQPQDQGYRSRLAAHRRSLAGPAAASRDLRCAAACPRQRGTHSTVCYSATALTNQ
jgi:hypothetical protein